MRSVAALSLAAAVGCGASSHGAAHPPTPAATVGQLSSYVQAYLFQAMDAGAVLTGNPFAADAADAAVQASAWDGFAAALAAAPATAGQYAVLRARLSEDARTVAADLRRVDTAGPGAVPSLSNDLGVLRDDVSQGQLATSRDN